MNEIFLNAKELMAKGNALMETVKKDDKLDWQQDFIAKAQSNPLYRRVLKEAVLSDVAGALGAVNAQVIDAAEKMAVAGDIIWKIPVTQPLTRFFKRKRGSVWRIAEGPPTQSPGRYETKDVSLDFEYGEDALFGQSYLEDCPFPVIERELAEVGQLLEEKLTSDIIALYDAIAAANLAGGAVVNTVTSGSLAWKDLTTGWRTLKKAGYGKKAGRKVLLVGPYEFEDLWNDDKFIHGFYFGSLADVARGVLGKYMDFTVIECDLMADDAGGNNGNFAYMMNVDLAAVCTMRRDKLTQPYEEKLASGVIATSRYGLGTLREDAVCRIDVVHA